MSLSIDHGRRVQLLDGTLCVVHEQSTRPDNDRPAAAGYSLVRAYRTATGPLCLWRRAFAIHPEKEQPR